MSKSNESTTKFKADISQLKQAMQDAARQVRLANSEFKAATAGMDDWSKSADGLAAKITQLDKTLSAQEKQLEALEKEYELTAKEQGENSKGAEELQIKINNQKAAIEQTKKELGKYNSELNDTEKQTDDTGKEVKDLGDETEESGKNAKDAADGFTIMKGAIANLVSDAIQAGISKLKEFSDQLVKVGINFDSSMSKVAAISGATADELQQLRDKAKEMGSTTQFTATEAAEAMNYMAMAGWKTEDMLKGIDGVMNLAAASGENLATVSDIVTDAMTAFGLSAQDAGHFADVLAKASSNANTNVSMMGESFKYVAPVAGALGYSVEDISTALGLMANSGIKASQAGTSLRTILTNLSSPSDKTAAAMSQVGVSLDDGEGNMLSFMEVMNQLRKGFGDIKISPEEFQRKVANLDTALDDGIITEKEYNKAIVELSESAYGAEGALKAEAAAAIGGQRGMSALLSIVNATDDDFAKLTKEIYSADGAAQDMAQTMLDNLGGDVTLLKSKIEGLQLELYEKLEPTLRNIVKLLGKLADAFSDANQNSKYLKASVIALATAIGTLTIITSITAAWKAYKAATEGATVAMWLFNAAANANPIAIVISALAALTAAFIYLWNTSDEFRGFWIEMWEGLKEKILAISAAIAKAFIDAWNTIKEGWNTVKGFFEGVWKGIKGAFEGASEWLSNVFTGSWEVIKTAWNGVTGFFQDIWSGIKRVFGNVKEWFEKVFTDARDAVKTVFDGFVEIIKAPINLLIDGLNVFIKGLNKIKIPSWVPGVGGKGLDFDTIDHLAHGGVLKRGQVGLLEGSGAEAVVPLEKNKEWIGRVVDEFKKQLDLSDLKIKVNINPADAGINAGGSGARSQTTNMTFNQYNSSPKALDRLSIYRETNALLFSAKVRMSNV